MKLLHCADLHLDSPFSGLTEAQTRRLRRAQLELPGKLAALCRAQGCELVLMAGDVFDGKATAESVAALKNAMEEMAVPVFLSPGNHDFCAGDSPYLTENWSENVHIFKRPVMESVVLPELDCRIYGAGYRSMDCEGLLEDFHAEGTETWQIAVLHGDATQTASPYCPVTAGQVAASGLDYLALGHIHKTGSFREGKTLCTWPGCPMGRGFDELGEKGVMVVTLEDGGAVSRFVALDTPRFYEISTEPGQVGNCLPAAGNDHFYRITLTGEAETVDLEGLYGQFSRFPNLQFRDRTVAPLDLWGSAGQDGLEGVYFRRLKEALEAGDEETRAVVTLAARISRQILNGQEVVLP